VSDRIRALILAAGSSRRLGRAKAMIKLPTGETLLARAIASARGAGLHAVVAIPPGDDTLAREAVLRGATFVVVKDAQTGMSASIRAGIASIESDPGIDAALILLADQWRVSADHLGMLVHAWRSSPSRMAGARYAGTLGVPAVFGREHFATLLSLQGDRGARDLLRDAARPVATVDMPAAEVDLDAPADIARLLTG
jgi:CTP:molybdopterin cytidylyltransferase MocA